MWSKSVPKDVVFEAGDADIVEITNHRKGSGGWELKYIMEEWLGPNNIKKIEDWAELETLFADCQIPVEEGKESENLVVTYCKVTNCAKDLKKKVAKLAGQSVENLFSSVSKKNKSINKEIQQSPAPPLPQPTMIYCNHSSGVFNCGAYVMEGNSFYFQVGRKWHGLPCKGCGTVIGTCAGQFKPTMSQPCYVCEYYKLDKTDCKEILCLKCYRTKSLEGEATDTNHSTRSNRKTSV